MCDLLNKPLRRHNSRHSHESTAIGCLLAENFHPVFPPSTVAEDSWFGKKFFSRKNWSAIVYNSITPCAWWYGPEEGVSDQFALRSSRCVIKPSGSSLAKLSRHTNQAKIHSWTLSLRLTRRKRWSQPLPRAPSRGPSSF